MPPSNLTVEVNKGNPGTQINVSFEYPEYEADEYIIGVSNDEIEAISTQRRKCTLKNLGPGNEYEIFAYSKTGEVMSKKIFFDLFRTCK